MTTNIRRSICCS